MATIYFVRHGEAAAGFAAHRDPGLSELGREQAQRTAEFLSNLEPIPLFSSPLKRAHETANALAKRWNLPVTLESRIAEIPSPIHGLEERSKWLASVMAGTWLDLSPELLQWREKLLDCVVSQKKDCVMFSHFVAINILAGAAQGISQMVSFRPNNASVTTFSNNGGELSLVELGGESDTHVN